MQERPSLVLLIHWASIPYISSVLGRGVIWVEAGGLLDFFFFPTLSLLFFFVSPIFTGVIFSPIFTGIIFSPGKAGRDFFRYSNIQVRVAHCDKQLSCSSAKLTVLCTYFKISHFIFTELPLYYRGNLSLFSRYSNIQVGIATSLSQRKSGPY